MESESQSEFRYRVVSPPGRSAIFVIDLIDLPASRWAEFFGARTHTRQVSYLRFLGAGGDVLDDGVWLPVDEGDGIEGTRRRSSERFSGRFTGHGNPVIVESIVARLRAAGGREAEPWSTWSEAPSRLEREAWAALAQAASPEAAEFLLGQIESGLVAWAGATDPEELSVEAIEQILARAPAALGWVIPATVVLVGVPNAGKSTLFNRWVGEARAVTHATPGTTRDLVEERVCCHGYPLRLIDGAGVRATDDPLEREGVDRLAGAASRASLVVVLTPPFASADAAANSLSEFAPSSRDVPRIHVRSRADEVAVADRREGEIYVSGATGEGLDAVATHAVELLYGRTRISITEPAPFAVRHVEALESVKNAIENGLDVASAWSRLVGEEDR